MADMTIQLPVSGCYKALEENTRRFVCLEGATRSTKTYSIIQYLILRCLREPVRVFAGRHDGTTCDSTIVQDWKDVISTQFCAEGHDAWDQVSFNKQRKRAEFASGAIWEFGGTSDEQKLHGHKQDILWLNEVMEISWEARKQLAQRTRELEIYDWNPSLTQHWVFDRIMTREGDFTYHHSTYKDNPFLSPAQVAEIEAYEPTPENIARGTADEWHWRVYGLGKRAGKKGRVFKLWEMTEDWPDRMLCQRYGFGLDFGFSQDPTALIECALYNDELYLRQQIYQTDLIVGKNVSQPKEPSIEGELERLRIGEMPIVADSQEPASIRTLQLSGFNVTGAGKGKGSVVDGINLMKQFRIKAHISSQDLQRELENYTWARKLDGTWLDMPVDEWNHAIDAARYWAMANLKPRIMADAKRGRSRSRQAKTPLQRY